MSEDRFIRTDAQPFSTLSDGGKIVTVDPAVGHIVTIDPGVRDGEPMLNRSSVSVPRIAEAWWTGHTLGDIYESLGADKGMILTACWYMAKYGSLPWRKRWGTWLRGAVLSPITYKNHPMPPQRWVAQCGI